MFIVITMAFSKIVLSKMAYTPPPAPAPAPEPTSVSAPRYRRRLDTILNILGIAPVAVHDAATTYESDNE